MDNLQRLHQKWADEDGFVYLVYCTQVYVAELINFAAEVEWWVRINRIGKEGLEGNYFFRLCYELY